MVENDRLFRAWQEARHDLLAHRTPQGHWTGELASSALSTATAVSALAMARRHLPPSGAGSPADERRLTELIFRGLDWLADHQNDDGGWGDTDRSLSNIATTMLVQAAFHLTCVPADHADLLDRAEVYVRSHGRVAGLRRRYGRDKTFAVPILTNCALAGLVSWREVSALPFELACLPQSWYRFLQLPVVSYAIPALVAIGQACYFHRRPRNPLVRAVRSAAVDKSLRVLEQMQPASGGFLEATPLTSFVVMSLASIGQVRHPVARRGLEFLLSSVRPDGSWPIDSNLATWLTTLSIDSLGSQPADGASEAPGVDCLDWLLSCQHREVHPYTGAAAGGWGWSDLSGAVPDADDTAGALLALAQLRHSRRVASDSSSAEQIDQAARLGVAWLLDLQNSDGGWPTFCRGWGRLPFDRSGTDLTAHVLRALRAWDELDTEFSTRIDPAVGRGFDYLARNQQDDGSWLPLWFGNQHHPREDNQVYGTARVLAAYRDFGRLASPPARRALAWLTNQQNGDGGWGGRPASSNPADKERHSSVEETALALEALLEAPPRAITASDAAGQAAAEKGIAWLVEAVEAGRHREPSPIGFYFAKLWYYETLYPLIFTVSALGRAAAQPRVGCPRETAPARQATAVH